MCGVHATDIESGIGFGESRRLRGLDRFIEGEFLEPPQDEVAGSIEDSSQAVDRAGRDSLLDDLQDRHCSRHRSLVVE